ncbi:MAG: hypothetical protein EOM37_06710 [Proteobacteria bacterium]|nr:hypothetical protein [Pseudomonadota bacterium]
MLGSIDTRLIHEALSQASDPSKRRPSAAMRSQAKRTAPASFTPPAGNEGLFGSIPVNGNGPLEVPPETGKASYFTDPMAFDPGPAMLGLMPNFAVPDRHATVSDAEAHKVTRVPVKEGIQTEETKKAIAENMASIRPADNQELATPRPKRITIRSMVSHAWANKLSIAAGAAAGWGTRAIIAKFGLVATAATAPGSIGVIAAGIAIGATAGAVAGVARETVKNWGEFRAMNGKQRKTFLIKSALKGAAFGALGGFFAIGARETFEHLMENQIVQEKVAQGIAKLSGFAKAAVKACTPSEESIGLAKSFVAGAKEKTASLFTFTRSLFVKDQASTIAIKPLEVVEPSAPTQTMASTPTPAPEAPIGECKTEYDLYAGQSHDPLARPSHEPTTKPVKVRPTHVAVEPVKLPKVPRFFAGEVSPETLSHVPENIRREMARAAKSQDPMRLMWACKEASFALSQHFSQTGDNKAAQAAYKLIKKGLQAGLDAEMSQPVDVAMKKVANGTPCFLETDVAKKLWADAAYFENTGAGGVKVDKAGAIYKAFMAGEDNKQANRLLKTLSKGKLAGLYEEVKAKIPNARKYAIRKVVTLG